MNQDDTNNKLNDQEHSELNELHNKDPKQFENDKGEASMPKNDSDIDINQEILFPLNVDDPGNWDKIPNIRDFLVERGNRKDDGILFHLDNTGRHFNPSHYKRQLSNGEKSDKRCKFLQAKNMDIVMAIRQLKGLISSLQEFRESGFDQALIEAEHIASEMGIEPIFREKRIIRRKRQFDEINREEVTQSPKESFRVNYFLFIVDQALSSLQTRFEQFQSYSCICRKEFFQVEIDQNLSPINYVTRKTKWLGYVIYREKSG
ncbi:uncharacterized protein LOC121978205 [Zingiber officinale]|uniref:uncharacterized protein LOC121978205 n=1 Tax=Zingiber officinale TaxID=94328 RepID=UPI001C4C9BE0|nr:uncharacterized protein LOC121978205 [Zingiber officinale]